MTDAVQLWRSRPPVLGDPAATTDLDLWPSARQALSAALREMGVSRNDRVVIPPWSSACVINAVGKVGTPLPLDEALAANRPVRCVLHYQQWGWAKPAASVAALCERLQTRGLLLDRVDSASLDATDAQRLSDVECTVAEIWSLAKLLGFRAGGVARWNAGAWFNPAPVPSGDTPASPWWEVAGISDDMLRNHAPVAPRNTRALRSFARLEQALTEEAARRRVNLQRVDECFAGAGFAPWPQWMRDSMRSGSPGIAPVLRDVPEQRLRELRGELGEQFGIETEVYRFDFSADACEPHYEPVLAVPVHAQMTADRLERCLHHLCESVPAVCGEALR